MVWGVYVDFLVVGSNPGDGKVEIFWVSWLRKCTLNNIGQTVFVHRSKGRCGLTSERGCAGGAKNIFIDSCIGPMMYVRSFWRPL